MYGYKNIGVRLNERVVVFDHSVPKVALGPGQHRVWGWRLSEQRWNTDQLVFDALPEVRAMLPMEQYRSVTLERAQRGVLYRNDKPQAYLRPGTHLFWTVDPSVRLQVYAVDEPMPELTDELIKVIPASEYTRKVIAAHERGLLFVKGQLVRTLAPGVYSVWSHPGAPAQITAVDTRTQLVTLAGQDLMTRDKVTLRLTLSVEYAVVDPAKATIAISDVRDAVYLLVQLAARDYVAATTLDQLLEGRDAMTRYLQAEVAPKALHFGVQVSQVGVKDVVLPGDMKTLLNRVIEAEKAAAANVILRREEAAATRLLTNTAKAMADHPVLLRLRELETMKEMAARIHEVRVVVGADGLQSLIPAQLLKTGKA